MTKIRTANQLQDVLDREFSWRLKEIHDIRTAVRSADSSAQRTLMRAGVTLLYAHWEGFVKTSAEAYVNFLALKGLRYSQLQSCFVALGLKGHINQISESSRSKTTVSAVEFILAELDKPARLPTRDSIDTQANLSSSVFCNIAGWIGIDAGRYATKFNFLDESLLRRRNRIAHGQYLELDATTFGDLVDQVLEIMRWFKNDLENALATEAYIRPIAPPAA